MADADIIGIVCGLSAAVAWGVADFWSAKAARSIGPTTAAIVVNIVGVIGFAFFYLITQPARVSGSGVGYAVAAGLLLGIGQVSLFQGLNAGPVGLVSSLVSAYPLITTVSVIAVFHEHVSPWQMAGIGTVMLGVFVASELSSLCSCERRARRGPAFALITAALWGMGYAFLAQALETLSWQTTSLIQLAVIAVVCLLLARLIKDKEELCVTSKGSVFLNKFVLGAGLTQMFGLVIINVGIEQDTAFAPAVTALSACYPVLTIVLALKHFGEKLKPLSLIGALLTIVGVIILSLG